MDRVVQENPHPSHEQLLAALEHGDVSARIEAAKELAFLDEPRVVDALTVLLQASPDQMARQWAAYALGFAGDERAEPALIAALRDRSNALEVRCHAAEALGHLLGLSRGHHETRAALQEALAEQPAALRFWSAFALGNFGIQSDIPRLQELASSDHRVVEGWWSVSKEAKDASSHIQGRRPGKRSTP